MCLMKIYIEEFKEHQSNSNEGGDIWNYRLMHFRNSDFEIYEWGDHWVNEDSRFNWHFGHSAGRVPEPDFKISTGYP